MVLFLVFGIVVLALLLVPEVFVALGRGVTENPELGVLFLPVIVLITVWIYKR